VRDHAAAALASATSCGHRARSTVGTISGWAAGDLRTWAPACPEFPERRQVGTGRRHPCGRRRLKPACRR